MASRTRSRVRPPNSTPAQRRALREHVRAECANKPGVYRMLGPTGSVLYVGQSRVLRTRLLSYFRASDRRDKAARILRHAFSIEWEYTNSEFGALLRELRLIKQHRPQFNSMLVTDDWPHAYIALTGGSVPGLRVVPRSDEPSAVALFGPFRKVSMVREAVRALSEASGLRDCPLDEASDPAKTATVWFGGEPTATTMRLPTRTRAPGCLRHELGTCIGPCIGQGDGIAYRQRVDTVRAFLEGKSDAPVNDLARAMEQASAALEFERAAVLRDRLERVRWLHQRVQHFRANVDRLTFRYHARGTDNSEWVYLVRRGTVRAEVPLPANDVARTQLEALAQRVYHGADPSGADIPSHDLDEFYLVASWFRRRPDERGRTYPAVSSRRAAEGRNRKSRPLADDPYAP